MPPDIKTFSDLAAIDTAALLRVTVVLVPHDDADYQFTINDLPVCTAEFNLLSPLHFKCTVKSGAVDVASILVNGCEVMPKYQHLSIPKTSWITDEWELIIAEPFYPWYHRITGQGWIA